MNKTIDEIRADFPILSQTINGKPLVYFDNGATSQKPQVVIDAIKNYYGQYNSNVHRGVHHLSQVATQKYEQSRDVIQQFIGAENREEVIFTMRNCIIRNIIAPKIDPLIDILNI